MNFEPTHQCFDDSLDLISLVVKQRLHLHESWRLVHAICKYETVRYAHAWCERDRNTVVTAYIIDGHLTYVEMRRRDFYRLYQPQMMTKYTVDEAMLRNMRSHHFGPWEQCYWEACGRGKEIFGSIDL